MKTQVTEAAPGTNKLVKATEFMLGYDSTISLLWIFKKMAAGQVGSKTQKKLKENAGTLW